jgi:hypothetical protein
VSLVGPRVAGITGSQDPRWFEEYDAAASSLTLGITPGIVRPGAAVAWLPSACLVGRTDAITPGFDAILRIGEDVDLVWRLVDAGQRVRYDPTGEAHHDAARPCTVGSAVSSSTAQAAPPLPKGMGTSRERSPGPARPRRATGQPRRHDRPGRSRRRHPRPGHLRREGRRSRQDDLLRPLITMQSLGPSPPNRGGHLLRSGHQLLHLVRAWCP